MVFGKIYRGVKRGVKKTAEFAFSKAKQRYWEKGPFKGPLQLAKDVAAMKLLLNVEKKRIAIQEAGAYVTVAQLYGATGSGHYTHDITPIPTQGTSASERTGDSIKLTGQHFRFAFKQLSACANSRRIRIMVFRNTGSTTTLTNGVGSTELVGATMEFNPWIFASDTASIYDFNCSRLLDKFGNWKLIKSVTRDIMADSVSGINHNAEVSFGIKYKKHHVRYNNGADTIGRGQIAMLVLCDNGNSHATEASTLTAAYELAALTGLQMRFQVMNYYVDN